MSKWFISARNDQVNNYLEKNLFLIYNFLKVLFPKINIQKEMVTFNYNSIIEIQ